MHPARTYTTQRTIRGRTSHCTRATLALVLLTVSGLAACSNDSLPAGPEATASGEPGASVTAAAAPNSWESRAPMPTPRSGLATATVRGLVYAVGGSSEGGSIVPLRTVEAYNPMTNSWSPKASLPEARSFTSGAAAINGKLYLSGGFDSTRTPTKTLFVYSPSTNTWARKADLPVASLSGISAVIGGQLYVLTPVPAGGGLPRLDRYDPSTDRWTPLAAPPRRHSRGAGGVINGKFYVAGGDEGRFLSRALDVYDPVTNTWSTKAEMPAARTAVGGGVLNGKLYVVGGSPTRDGSSAVATVEVYNPKTDRWVTKAPMLTPRSSLAAGRASGLLFALGGGPGDGTVLATSEAYTP